MKQPKGVYYITHMIHSSRSGIFTRKWRIGRGCWVRSSRGREHLLDDLVAERRDLRVQRLDGLLLLRLEVAERLDELGLHGAAALVQLGLQLRGGLLLHLVERGGDLRAGRLEHGLGLLLQLPQLLGRVLDAAQLGADLGVPVVHELAQRREVELVQRHHEQQELDRDEGEREVEVEERRLLDIGC